MYIVYKTTVFKLSHFWWVYFLFNRFYIESISYLKDNATIELFFLNAKSCIYKVNCCHCSTTRGQCQLPPLGLRCMHLLPPFVLMEHLSHKCHVTNHSGAAWKMTSWQHWLADGTIKTCRLPSSSLSTILQAPNSIK